MSTFTVATAYTYAHTVTHVTTKMLLTLKEIIRQVGLDPSSFAEDWQTYELAISTWLNSRHLQKVILEVYDPSTSKLATAWEIEIVYVSIGDGAMWVDTDAIRYAILKAGCVPSTCRYDIVVQTAAGRPDVPKWGSVRLRSRDGFRRYSLGATIGGDGLSAQAAYWSR
jgi:hypothetical protein